MTEVKLTKLELRNQQIKLGQLQKYLPTLQLKKAMLQAEVNAAQAEIMRLENAFTTAQKRVLNYSSLLTSRASSDLFAAIRIREVRVHHENIAGIDVPCFDDILFEPAEYALFDTPIWMEAAASGIQLLLSLKEQLRVSREKKIALEKELREVSIRVNLFEKIMIPRAFENIKKIKIFLGDQQLAAVSRAKVAKRKIEERAGDR